MNDNILYIGLKGYAGSGKDTIAKMLKIILEYKDTKSKDECFEMFLSDDNLSATLKSPSDDNIGKVYCIAYADQLKLICSELTGIPLIKFYTNKSSGYINISGDFSYTENLSPSERIVTAAEYHSCSPFKSDAWMSLREFLVYIGTYVLQFSVNKNVFVNYIKNKIKNLKFTNQDLRYVIVTDNRFYHEADFIKAQHGVFILIERDNINKLNNIAENDLDDEDYFSDIEHYFIYNNGTYKELFESLWELIQQQVSFKNVTYDLITMDNFSNQKIYLKLVNENETYCVYSLNYNKGCGGISYISHNAELINEMQIIGCMYPIKVGEVIKGTHIMCSKIEYNYELDTYVIYSKKQK